MAHATDVVMLHEEHVSAPWKQASVNLQATKTVVGRLRPDFLDRCKPAAFLGNSYSFRLDIGSHTDPGCTETDRALLDDGRSSFPSGEALCALCALLRQTLCDCLSAMRRLAGC